MEVLELDMPGLQDDDPDGAVKQTPTIGGMGEFEVLGFGATQAETPNGSPNTLSSASDMFDFSSAENVPSFLDIPFNAPNEVTTTATTTTTTAFLADPKPTNVSYQGSKSTTLKKRPKEVKKIVVPTEKAGIGTGAKKKKKKRIRRTVKQEQELRRERLQMELERGVLLKQKLAEALQEFEQLKSLVHERLGGKNRKRQQDG